MKRSGLGISVRVVLGYLFFASLWILLSDRVAEMFAANADEYAALQTFKGLAFVAASALLIFWLLQRELNARSLDENRRRAAEEALQQSEAMLAETQHIAKLGGWELETATWNFSWTEETARIYEVESIHSVSKERVLGFFRESQRQTVLTALQQACENAMPFEMEQEILTAKGQSKWVRILGRSKTKEGNVVKLIGSIQDITAHKQAELTRKNLEDQLAAAQQMESIGRLAGGVAHDFNNLLTVILYHASVIEEEADSGRSFRDEALQIREAGERAAALTRRLLTFSRRQAVQFEVIHLNDVILSIETMLRRLIGEDIDVVMSLSPETRPIEADRSQMEQILLNLAVNARDAMPSGGRISISTREIEIDAEARNEILQLPFGHYIEMTFTDSGVGMDDETQRRAFEPFFTTKEVGKGTGLGLAMVYGVVKQSNGRISLESTPGKGTTVRIFLPCVSDASPVEKEKPAQPEIKGRGETVLLAEDDDRIRSLSKEILEREGYCVIEAPDTDEALSYIAFPNKRIELLLTDVIMPKMNGYELAKRILAKQPWVKVIFMSGYTDDILSPQGVSGRNVTLLEKPFSREALASIVRKVLDGKSPGGIGDTAHPSM